MCRLTPTSRGKTSKRWTTKRQRICRPTQTMSREITVSEYQMLESITQISNEKAIDEYTLQLIEEGVL